MKTLLLSINSKFIHTLLAPRYLKANCAGQDIEILESNVNIKLFDFIEEIYQKKPDVIAVSCYVFNIDYVYRLLKEIKLVLPDVKIILGGYEAAFDCEKYLPLCDYIIKGEADLVFCNLLSDIKENTCKFLKVTEAKTVKNLDGIISPFTKEYCVLGNEKILYMETSRGCPFCCSYCMSANTMGVRTFSQKRIFTDISTVLKYAPKQIKFVDRTFNYDLKRATAIFNYILENFGNTDTNFHFEMAPELFDEEMFLTLKKAKKGLFQFEIGIQSYNSETLDSIKRKADFAVIENNITRLIKMDNIHIHTDLIAGLPYEDLNSFIKGFDRLFYLKPHCLQLGFLKILKGSKIYGDKEQYTTQNAPPYEVVKTPCLDFDDILKLKTAEKMLNMFYNSGRFFNSLNFLIPKYFSPYNFFYEIGLYFKENGLNISSLSAFFQCDALYNFAEKSAEAVTEKDDTANFLIALQNVINDDYTQSGNIRKWRRHIQKD